jgi:hypothetical protein
MPGDVVRHISGKNNQRGYVQDLDVKCHLHIKGSNKYIYNVDAKDLLPLRVNIYILAPKIRYYLCF